MKPLIALAIIWIEISGATPTVVVSGFVGNIGANHIDYGMTYDGANGILKQAPTISATNSPLTVLIQGASITNADHINSYLLASSSGGDLAVTGLDVTGVNGHDASVKNYNMCGYVTSNLAYAGQYADSITGESLYLRSSSFNYVVASSIPLPPQPNYAAAIADVTTTPPDTHYTKAEIYGANAGGTDRSLVALTNAFQHAEAGGSSNPPAYALCVNDVCVNKVGSMFTGVNGGTLFEDTESKCGTAPALGTASYIGLNGEGSLASPEYLSMGYESKYNVYSNENSQTSVSAPGTGPFASVSSYYTYYFNGKGVVNGYANPAKSGLQSGHAYNGFTYSEVTVSPYSATTMY